MTNHEITNKMAAAAAHLRTADTYCASVRVIDEIRAALSIVLEVGEETGKELIKEEV